MGSRFTVTGGRNIFRLLVFAAAVALCGCKGSIRGLSSRPDADLSDPDGSADVGVRDASRDGSADGSVVDPDGTAPPVCGNAVCDTGEDCVTCPDDCGPCCPNGACDSQEDCAVCPQDCGGCPGTLEIRDNYLGLWGSDGQWHVALSCGERVMVTTSILDSMVLAGKNFIRIDGGAGAYYRANLGLYVNNHFDQGINASWLSDVDAFLGEALQREIGVVVGLWGTVALEWPAPSNVGRRWEQSPWNANSTDPAGGPYDTGYHCGKDTFFTFDNYGTHLYQNQPYPSSGTNTQKGQWRQEEVVWNLMDVIKNYPNTAIKLMGEAYDTGSNYENSTTNLPCSVDRTKVDDWHTHMTAYVKSINPSTLVATDDVWHLNSTGVDFMATMAGPGNYFDNWCSSNTPVLPVVSVGWGDQTVQDSCCGPVTCGAWAWTAITEHVRAGWLCGLQTGGPWHEYRQDCYEPDQYDPWFLTLRGFLDGVTSWDNEPGDEITAGQLPPPL